MHGIAHTEIPANDLEKIAKFYSDVFGWEINHMPEMDYTIFKTPNGPGGGFNKQAEISAKPGITFYIEVENMEATLEKIKSAGGEVITKKTEIAPEMGFYSFFKDVEGNQIGLWSAK